MKKMGKLLAGSLVLFATASCVMAADTAASEKVEAYAHPSMFGSQAQETSSASAAYVVGGKVAKSNNKIGVANKDKVLIESWAKDCLNAIKAKQESFGITGFDAKAPVLRSELAATLAEGFNLTNTKASKPYSDVNAKHWANDWINAALNAGVMIGYPDKTFRPDQAVTKAEVFAVIAQLINVPTDKSLIVPEFKGSEINYIPRWAIAPTKEVVASELLESVPYPEKVNNDEYLSKEQVAYLIAAVRQDWALNNRLGKDPNASAAIQGYAPTVLTIKLADRLSARHSNVGEVFSARTTSEVTINGTSFPAGSNVYGEVIEVVRPGVDNAGYIKVKFTKIKNGDVCAEIPNKLSQAQADQLKDPNILARLLGMPFSGAGRIVGVAGRTTAAAANVSANSLEELGDNLSDTLVDTFSLHPGAGLRSFGTGFVTVGKGLYNLGKLAVSGTFGVVYEVADELRYVIVPKYSNASSLNPGEELTIVF